MEFLKKSTAVVIQFGPFVDKGDGVTPRTDATTIQDIDHGVTGIFLSKNGGTAAIRHQAVTPSIVDSYGMMKVALDATDTNTVGTLDVLYAKASRYLAVIARFMVLPANVYDSMMGTDILHVDAGTAVGGAIAWSYTITETGTGLPISDVDVWVTTDINGVNVIASGRTDQTGKINFYLDAGTVYVWRQKSGYNFTNPDVEVVV